MPVLMMCPVHLACSSVLLVICCFFVSCLPKGHYIISKTKRNASIIYQGGLSAHLSLISRPCSVLPLQPHAHGVKHLLHEAFIEQELWIGNMKLAVLHTEVSQHLKRPAFLNFSPLVPLLLCPLLTEHLFISKSKK